MNGSLIALLVALGAFSLAFLLRQARPLGRKPMVKPRFIRLPLKLCGDYTGIRLREAPGEYVTFGFPTVDPRAGPKRKKSAV
jgi:hypothetical protein